MTDTTDTTATELATFGGGCFWCLEAVFEQLRGVTSVTSGYAGGNIDEPTYEQVCTGRTGHAEVIQIAFNPEIITFEDLLGVFFAVHDPTTLNRQGADVGTQYRSVIFIHSPAQHEQAIRKISELNAAHAFASPIVTELAPIPQFFPAERYHQGYFRSNESQPYCQRVVSPKVTKFRSKFPNQLKD
ncbi:MAG: peptide-methionine (S)-S-oxide reductase MsrA [Planctomycetota bacterium]